MTDSEKVLLVLVRRCDRETPCVAGEICSRNMQHHARTAVHLSLRTILRSPVILVLYS